MRMRTVSSALVAAPGPGDSGEHAPPGQVDTEAKQVRLKFALPPGTYTLTNQTSSETTTLPWASSSRSPPRSPSRAYQLAVAKPDSEGQAGESHRQAHQHQRGGGRADARLRRRQAGGRQQGARVPLPRRSSAPPPSPRSTRMMPLSRCPATPSGTHWPRRRRPTTRRPNWTSPIGHGDRMIEQAFRLMEGRMPRTPVAVGETWQRGLRLDVPRLGEVRVRYSASAQEPRIHP